MLACLHFSEVPVCGGAAARTAVAGLLFMADTTWENSLQHVFANQRRSLNELSELAWQQL